ncbi:DUF58 domain-containing protein [Clostridium amazonitimonense]|uniref:DUF58 domain-containing protein n=1 Tax=Clostridium amazonitimonense TaxID=1499689 RepID=UPI000509842A|nr:DUF58 domain-containing protein [Clostridium amazonitimonense]
MAYDIFDKDFFKRLYNININLNMRLSLGNQGGRKSHAKGISLEFSDFREYVPGDDIRRIDWNAYARSERLFIKLFMEEREAVFNFFIDGSKSMDFGEYKKSHQALRVAGALSYIVLNNLDRVGVNILNSEGLENIKSGSGKIIFQSILKELSEIDFQGKNSIYSSIKRFNPKRKGVSILVSDFFHGEPLEESIKYLVYKKQKVILIHVLSKEELEPELNGNLNLIDSESGEDIRVSVNPSVLAMYEKGLLNFKKHMESLASKYGALYVPISSEDSLEKIIFQDLTLQGFINKI